MGLFEKEPDMFPTSYTEIRQRVRNINPLKYGSSRNYLDGSVTYLSPYISRGVISTKMVLSETLKKGYSPDKIEKFIQELAWRDYWQQVWIAKGKAINSNLKHEQLPISNTAIPAAITEFSTGITAIDHGIEGLYERGYMHNHLRMYTASIACNVGQSHWHVPAKWMYYYLLDADWASNALSWQWVAGANSNKKYVANQENINKYCGTQQNNTFLDVPYEAFPMVNVPEVLLQTTELDLKTTFPQSAEVVIDKNLPVCVYNFYNLDPLWKDDISANRILLLEPSHFEEYPISPKTLNFIRSLARENIDQIQVFVGEFHELASMFDSNEIYFKEHPLNAHYNGVEEPRDWMFEVDGYYPSFFAFWKKCKKQFSF
jgi:deoxyribodipyrimidine photo-lyase